jgi:hypothetical protein
LGGVGIFGLEVGLVSLREGGAGVVGLEDALVLPLALAAWQIVSHPGRKALAE